MPVNQLKAGAVLNYVILGLNAIVGIAYTPYMLRMLGQSEYGIYSLAASVIAYLSILDLGFGNAVIRYTAKFRAEGKKEEQYSMFGMFTILYSVIAAIAFIAGLVLYFNIDNLFGETLTAIELDRTRIIVLLMVFNLAVTFPLSIYGAIITAYEDFIFLRVVQIARILLNTAVMICLLHYGYKAIAMVVVQTVFNLATLILNVFYCRYRIHVKVLYNSFNRPLLKEIAIYSFWIFLNVIMDRIYWSTGQFILGATFGTIAVSVFALAIQLQGMYMMFSSGISSVFLPRVTAMVAHNNNNAHEISNLFIKVGRLQYAVMSLILFGFFLFGRQFVMIWAGKAYSEAYTITLMFFVALLVPLIQNMGIIILQARNQMRFRSILYIFIAIVSLVAQIILTKYYGVIGCAIAISGALLLGQGLILNIYYQRVQKIDILLFWKNIIKMTIAPLFLTVATYFLVATYQPKTIMKLAFCIVLFIVAYLLIFSVFSLNKYEKNLFFTPIIRVRQKIKKYANNK